MTELVFVDTNVLVYARDASDPSRNTQAMHWMEMLWRDRCGRISTQVLSEYYVTVTRKLKPGLSQQEAWDDVSALMTWDPLPTDRALLQRGWELRRRFQLGWWDSLLVGAAQAQGCSILLSEDLQDGSILGGVVIRNPFTTQAQEPIARYSTPVARPSHPPRGRPRRTR